MAILEFVMNYGFMSNFFPCNIEGYPSVEHAYQASKTLNPHHRVEIKNAPTAGKAKRLGRKVELRPDWEEIKLDRMDYLLRIKFAGGDLLDMLLATYPHVLVEGNYWHDNFWGVCFCKKCKVANGAPSGDNHMGRILMKIRNSHI